MRFMKNTIANYPDFLSAIRNNEIVYLFGAGISSSLSNNHSCSWWQWIINGINCIQDKLLAKCLLESIKSDDSTDNLVKVVGEVIKATKDEGVYEDWMCESIESAHVENFQLAETLKKLLITQDIFATTNYDLLLEEATGLYAVSYLEPAKAFEMVDKRMSSAVIHLHGIYDSANGIDSIVADEIQYSSVLNDKGAQFIQNILGTRTLIFVGCGQTTEDANISQFIQFARKYLRMDVPYYFLHKDDNIPVDMPDNIKPIPYGGDYADLPFFLEDVAQERLKYINARNKIVGRTIYDEASITTTSLLRYHYSQESIPFCGRVEELESLDAFIDNDTEFSWWTITGQAGSGKSRLAYEYLHRISTGWYGFFLDDHATVSDINNFKPFTNTLIVIDYISGREFLVAGYVSELKKLFESSPYKLRILLIERDNNKKVGSWYSKFIHHFSKYDDVANAEYVNDFLHLNDLDINSVELFIGFVCKSNGLDNNAERDKHLRIAYGNKFEKLRFRPLYLQLFIEAWITNNFLLPQYDSYEDLLRYSLEREQEKWLVVFDGDQDCCNSFLKLVIRANITGRLLISDIPDMYKADWEKVDKFIKEHSFPGKQRLEERISLISSVCQNNDLGENEIIPLYPDIIKEFMFSYYIDSENVPDVVAELWTNAAAFFSIFITRCLTDFPENDFYKNVLNDTSRLDKNVLLGRLNLLRHWKIKDDDDPFVLYGIVRNEYEFWKSIKIPETEDAETYGILKINGLNLVAKQFGGWSRYDVSDMVEATNESLKVNTGIATKFMNQFFLQEHITELSKAGFFEEAEYLRGKSEEILEKEDDSSWTSVIQLQNLNAEMMENILQDNFWKAYEVLKRMDAKCSLADINSVRVFAHSCFNIDHLSSIYKPSYTGKGYKLLQKAELLYPTDPSINARIVGCKVLILQKNYFENKIDNAKLMSELIPLEAVLSELVSDGEHDTENAISIAWGLLLTLKLNCVETDEDELNSLICLSTEILKDHPNYEEVASAKIMATCVLHENILHTKVSHAEVEELFKFVEMNNYSNSLRECFFNMLDKSEDSSLRANYITKKVALGARQGAAYDPLIGSGIVEFDEEADLQRQIYEYTTQEPYVRDHRKYGANEKCPCGSGLKFKKCCKGKGIYD